MTDKYKEYLIAFLDILGFKKIINSSSFDEVASIFNAIYAGDSKKQLLDNLDNYMSLEGLCEDKNTVSNHYKESIEKAKIYIMSDSIVIATPDLYPESLAVVCDLCHAITIQLLDMESPVLLRGAVSKGEFYIGKGVSNKNDGEILQNEESDNVLVFGKGLVDAYLAQEKYAVVPRVIVSKSVQEGKRVSLYLDVKLSKDKEDGYEYLPTLDTYLTNAIGEEANNIEKKEISYYESLYQSTKEYKKMMRLIDAELAVYNDLTIRKKYVWLENEIQRIKKEYLQSHGIHFMSEATFMAE